MPRMSNASERRQGPDRRRQPRGGRRPGDVSGFTPLVMVVDPESRRRDLSEAILARLRFAVAPIESVERAAAVIGTLAPEVIVAGEEDAYRIRELAGVNLGVPILALGDETRVSEALIEAVRGMLRQRLLEG
jgi:hypothetical protein